MKKGLCIILVTIMLFSIAACGAPAVQETQETTPKVSASAPAETPEATVAPTSEPVVVFTDTVLEAKVCEAMGKPEGDITLAEAESVEKLALNNKDFDDQNSKNGGIKDISALQYFTGLKELDISFNNISDLSPLSGLTNLETLVFNGTQVKDLSPLKDLKNMVCIVFCWNYAPDRGYQGFENLDALANMKNLEHIDAKNAGIKDLSTLGTLTKLWDIQLCDNQISDITPLANLKDLKILFLGNNPITDYSPVADVYPNLDSDFELK